MKTIPFSEHQLRTYLDTGKVTVEIPCTREHSQETPGPSNDSLFYDPAEWRRWAERHPERAASTTVWSESWEHHKTDESGVDWNWGHEDGGGTTELVAPYLSGERVAIGEEWRCPCWEYDKGVGIYYRDGELMWLSPDGFTEWARENLSRKWRPADTMPVWASRHHATVATIAFERRGDVWAWIVGLEAENAD